VRTVADVEEIRYDDETKLAEVLVGRRIVEIRKGKTPPDEDWYRSGAMDQIEYVLDDGTVLEARETDGGCGCSNGCWSVAAPDVAPDQVITSVETVEELDGEWSSHGDGEATLRLFVYADQVKTELVTSQGGDNGCYGWGYALYVRRQGGTS
jgi:hypothetical protein